MITVSISKLIEAVSETKAFELPGMTDGTSYLYNTVYRRLSCGDDVRLSDLNFDEFTDGDIDSLDDLHTNVFERNGRTAYNIASELRRIEPICTPAGYV